jgi:hypothetical protein
MEQLKCRLFEIEVKKISKKSKKHKHVCNLVRNYIYNVVDLAENGKNKVIDKKEWFSNIIECITSTDCFYPEDAMKILEIFNKYLTMSKSVKKDVFSVEFGLNEDYISFEKCIDDDELQIKFNNVTVLTLGKNDIEAIKELINNDIN